MPKVKLLSDVLASQVAAGEVVERPASVVKELVENSLDAGAAKIEVVIRRGGVAMIRVIDDGCGMAKEDALMSLERHATSKLRTKKDLENIGTLGFRGEALPSIASVSKFTLSTREKDAISGTEIQVDGGKVTGVGDSGEAPGTQIEVRTLFFNVPARRKFLRTEATEFGHIEHQLRLQAIAHPDVAFTLIHNDRVCFQLAAGTRLERIRGIAGGETAGKLLVVEHDSGDGVRVSGFAGDPRMQRSQRSSQLFFLNGRPVENKILGAGVREGYRGLVAGGGFPVVFLFLEVPPGEVDVNVHPAKREVRFRRGERVREAITEAICSVFVSAPSKVAGGGFPEAPGRGVVSGSDRVNPAEVSVAKAEPLQVELEADVGEARGRGDGGGVVGGAAEMAAEAPEAFELLSLLERGYVLLRSGEGLVLMDQRAAHERVLYESFCAGLDEGRVPEQGLLVPYTVELSPKDFAVIHGNLETLALAGVRGEVFGSNTIKIDALPACMAGDDAAGLVDRMIAEMRTCSRGGGSRLAGEAVAEILARLAAVKRTEALKGLEAEALVEDLMGCEMPYCSPAGKPTLIQISYPEIDRKFGK
ncbi:MAG: DNA mismatch repair endonuclease MutL [Verrucomicrobiales bacterium]|nr:DNA mismatch repair endonuclease MutL [Verrucomicrobiales bacterium]